MRPAARGVAEAVTWVAPDHSPRITSVESTVSKPSRAKLVEPGCDEGAGRVETMVTLFGVWGWVLTSGCGLVSTQPFAGAHVLAQPASREGVFTFWFNRLRGGDSGRSFLAARFNWLVGVEVG